MRFTRLNKHSIIFLIPASDWATARSGGRSSGGHVLAWGETASRVDARWQGPWPYARVENTLPTGAGNLDLCYEWGDALALISGASGWLWGAEVKLGPVTWLEAWSFLTSAWSQNCDMTGEHHGISTLSGSGYIQASAKSGSESPRLQPKTGLWWRGKTLESGGQSPTDSSEYRRCNNFPLRQVVGWLLHELQNTVLDSNSVCWDKDNAKVYRKNSHQ
jgi:hypothetical protein